MEKIKLPGRKPRIILKEQLPDQRKFCVVPMRAVNDATLTKMQLRTLLAFCSYSNRSGVTWVSLKRIGEHLGIGVNRTAVHTRALIAKGYIKSLYKGFAGQRAHTRQIIYDVSISANDAIAITGEKPPFMLEQENRQLNQLLKGKTMQKRGRKKKDTVTVNEGNNLEPGQITATLGENQMKELQRIVSPDVLAAAIQQAGPGADMAAVERALQRMLM